MFNKPELGVFLLTCHILACITVGILFRFYGRKSETLYRNSSGNILQKFKKEFSLLKKNLFSNIGGMLGDAIKNSIMTLLAIGGFIVFFSVIINLLIRIGFIDYISSIAAISLSPIGIDKSIVTSIISGFFEITSGTNMCSTVPNISLDVKIISASLIIGWAGLSVHAQVLSIINHTDISIKPYLLGKTLQGIFAAIYTYIGLKISHLLLLDYQPTFSSTTAASQFKWLNYLAISSSNLFFVFIAIFICITIITFLSAIRRKLKI